MARKWPKHRDNRWNGGIGGLFNRAGVALRHLGNSVWAITQSQVFLPFKFSPLSQGFGVGWTWGHCVLVSNNTAFWPLMMRFARTMMVDVDAQNRGIQRGAIPNQARTYGICTASYFLLGLVDICNQIKTGERNGLPSPLSPTAVELCQTNGITDSSPSTMVRYKSNAKPNATDRESLRLVNSTSRFEQIHPRWDGKHQRSLHRIAGRDGMHKFVLRIGVKQYCRKIGHFHAHGLVIKLAPTDFAFIWANQIHNADRLVPIAINIVTVNAVPRLEVYPNQRKQSDHGRFKKNAIKPSMACTKNITDILWWYAQLVPNWNSMVMPVGHLQRQSWCQTVCPKTRHVFPHLFALSSRTSIPWWPTATPMPSAERYK